MRNAFGHMTSGSWGYPKLAAHRCGGSLAPENTLAGLDAAMLHGYRMVEFDAKLSADGQVYLLHDDTLDRTTNGQGAASGMAWAQLAELDAGSRFSAEFAGERLPRFDAIAARCAQLGMAANIEIKPCPGGERETGRAVALAAREMWATGRTPLLSSFSVDALAAARDVAPSLPRGMLFETIPSDWRYIVKELDCISLHADHETLDESFVAECHAEGLRVLAYTVNDPERATTLSAWGVDLLCTDRLDLLKPEHFA
ncbi:glycerophosphoryl diester phosphodiesterase [Burkholderia pyrrocinia]|nr:glycerophosphoryl diester phosphodiesterase [Burkholderia pyrrocinia]